MSGKNFNEELPGFGEPVGMPVKEVLVGLFEMGTAPTPMYGSPLHRLSLGLNEKNPDTVPVGGRYFLPLCPLTMDTV